MVMHIERLAKQATAHQQLETAALLKGLAKAAKKARVPEELATNIPQEIKNLADQLEKFPSIASALRDTSEVAETEEQAIQKRKETYTRSGTIQKKHSVRIDGK